MEAKKSEIEIAKFCEEIIGLVEEKINALQQKNEEIPCEEEAEDQEFVE